MLFTAFKHGGRSVGLVVLLSWSVAIAAEPTDEDRARALFDKAEIQFNLGKFAEALQLYSKAYELKPLPGFLFNVGQCHRHLKHYEQAIFSYRMYLERSGRVSNAADVEQLIAMCQQALAEQQRGRSSGPGQQLPGGQQQPAAGQQPAPPEQPRPHDQGTAQLVLWSGVALTAALLATGIATGQLAANRSDAYNDPRTTPSRRQELKDAGEPLVKASIGTFAAAGAVAVGTALYYWLGYRQRPRHAVSALPLGRGGAFMLSGEF